MVFFPPNTTSRLQPLDRGVIEIVKQKYRTTLVRRYLREMDTNTDEVSKKEMNILDAMQYIIAAWNK